MTRAGLLAAVTLLIAARVGAQTSPAATPPLTLIRPEAGSGPPLTLTLQDALDRAKQNDAQFLSAAADADVAREERVQAKAALFPAFSATTQYLGNQANGVNPNGRFVSLDGVNMYRAWAVMHQDLSPSTFAATPLHKAKALEAAAQARLEVAERGLAVTVTRHYYALVTAQRGYATAQAAAQQAARFLEIARQQERLGQLAHSDVVRAEIQSRQQAQSFNDAALGMDNARLTLAVLLFPAFNENFTVVDDLQAAPALPPFADVRTMAEHGNPDLRAADAALAAAGEDVRQARFGFFPTLVVDAVYGIEANEFALHSAIAAQPELGILPNLGYFVTVNLSVPVWDWGGLRSKLHQGQIREQLAKVTLSQTQRQLVSSLYSSYNEAMAARLAADSLQRVADLATESLRLTTLRYQAGESTTLEMVDAQNTLVQARNAADEAAARYRLALAQLQTLTGRF
jgi:outer membrane protein TolC